MALAAARARRAVTHAVAAAVAALMREWIMLVRARRSPAVFAAIPQAAHALTRIVIADAMTCTAARASARNLLAAFASEAASASAGACAVGAVRALATPTAIVRQPAKVRRRRRRGRRRRRRGGDVLIAGISHEVAAADTLAQVAAAVAAAVLRARVHVARGAAPAAKARAHHLVARGAAQLGVGCGGGALFLHAAELLND